MNLMNTNPLQKTIISAAIASVLSLGATTANADIYEFTYANGGCTPATGPGTTCTGPGDAVFTILNSLGAPTQNNSYPYYGDPTWGYGKRTQFGGSITLKETKGAVQGKGVATINQFDFFASGPAVAADVTMADIGDGSGILGTGTLWLAQMLFNWNGNNGIPVSLAWDLQGLLGGLSGLDVNNIANPANVIQAVGAVPGSNGMKGSIPIGAAPVATTTFNTTPLCTTTPTPFSNTGECLAVNPSGALPLISDGSGIGGSPMIDGPFNGFNANFDISKLTLSGYNDLTAPVVTLGNTAVTVVLGGAFDPNNPGVSVTCTDNADGSDDISALAATNPNLSFTVGGAVVDVNTEANYPVTYTCTDSARLRAAIASNPDVPANATIPADNTSATKTLTVTVSDVDRPVISVTSPVTHEACTVYSLATDAVGVSATDLQDGDLTASITRTDNNAIIGNSPAQMVATIDYDVSDSGTGNPGSTPLAAATQARTVNIVDTLPPVLTVAGAPFNIESSACAAFNASLPTAAVVDANGDCSPSVTNPASTANTVNCTVPNGQDTQQSTLLYTADDTANTPNTGNVSAIVTVSRSEPVITLVGGGVILNVGDTYTEQGMDIHDVQDGDLTAVTTTGTTPGAGAGAGNLIHNIVIRDSSSTIVPSVDTSVDGGRYTISYDVTDSNGNTATQLTRKVSVGVFAAASNFTMLNPDGNVFGGTNDVVFDWDESLNSAEADLNFNMTISSALPELFFGAVWTAHHTRVFGEGTYSFDSGCTTAEIEATGCPAGSANASGPAITMTVDPGQVGAHILFDYNGTFNIDVVNVWDKDAVWEDLDGAAIPVNNLWDGEAGSAPDPLSPWRLVSRDVNGDGKNGAPMVDGPFAGFYANFNAGPGGTLAPPEPITTTVVDTKLGSGAVSWLALLGMLPLIGLFRRNKKSQR